MEPTHYPTTFFYAGSDAELYDATARMTERSYDGTHEVASRCLNVLVNRRSTRSEALILDLGCGTGEEAFRALDLIPTARIICVDVSSEMLELCRQKAIARFGEQLHAERFVWVKADFRDEEAILAAVRAERGSLALDAVISVYAFHHLEAPAKQEVYSYVNRLLQPGLPFINADLFSYQSEWAASLAQAEEEAWLQSRFSDPSEWMRVGLTIGEDRTRSLLESWMSHLRHDNKPLPISLGDDSGREVTMSTETHLLKTAGFSSVECLFRHYQSGVLIASK